MSAKSFDKNINIVINALRKAGYDPYDQLYGYVQTGNSLYITRKNNARQIIVKMDPFMIRRSLQVHKSGK